MPTFGCSKQSTGQQGKTILKYCKGKTYIAIGAWAGGNYRKSEELVHHVRCRVVQTKQISKSRGQHVSTSSKDRFLHGFSVVVHKVQSRL